ncbi:hypothetical protein AX16_009931 [Volvariella volvacea WC 439]|nr:hypothetical protein AX16_009931 [Volvariella volvacea WC 439]
MIDRYIDIILHLKPSGLNPRFLCEQEISQCPLTYLDKHIDDHLTVKSIQPLSGLVPLLLLMGDATVTSSRSQISSLTPPKMFFKSPFSFSTASGKSLAINYLNYVSLPVNGLMTTMMKENSASTFSSYFGVSCKVENGEVTELRCDREALRNTPKSTRKKMLEIAKSHSKLAVWYFITSADGMAESIVRNIGILLPHKPKWTISRTQGYPQPTARRQPPPDASHPLWASLLDDTRDSSSQTPPIKTAETGSQIDKVITTPPMSEVANGASYEVNSDDFLQRAWAHALIDVCDFSEYGKLQMGLYTAILEDAESRLGERNRSTLNVKDMKSESALGKRARSPSPEESNHKRQRTETAVPDPKPVPAGDSVDVLHLAASDRKIALVKICYDSYNSPSPISALRREISGRDEEGNPVTEFVEPNADDKYSTSQLAWSTREGKLTLDQEDSTVPLSTDIVIKFVYKAKARRRLQREYYIYQKLEAKGVKGVPRVFGLFQDLEDGIVIMILTHAGIDLWARAKTIPADELLVTFEEREKFIAILKDIHAAGVRHRDIRPSNLSIDKHGQPHIIDFDQAYDDAKKHPSKCDWEMRKMRKALDTVGNGNDDVSDESDYPGDWDD